jgi:type IV pilus assembly protein PilC
MNYRYQAYKAENQVAEGVIEAVSEKNAEEALYRAGYKYVLNLSARPARRKMHELLPSIMGIKPPDIIDFSRQLAAFLESGSSLHSSLELLEQQAAKPSLKAMIASLITQLEEGASFSQAVRSFPEVFPNSYWQVIQSCEKTGEIEKGLVQIADYLEKRLIITDKIKRALAYPVFVVCLAVGVVILLVTTVFPSIIKLFESYHTTLPGVTLLAISIINFLTTYKFQILIAVLGLVCILVLLNRLPFGRLLTDRFLLSLPVVGTIIKQHYLGLFCRTSSMLMKAGLPLPGVMDVSIKAAGGNSLVKRSLNTLKDRLMQGEGMSSPMARDTFFPPMMVRMIAVGEHTGTLDSTLGTLADYFEDHSNKKIQTLISLIEPTLTVCIGIGIAFIMLSMIIPIYRIMGGMR